MQLKVKKEVPAGIRYLSQWSDFRLSNFPGHCILHKQLPGCGFTEFALTCPECVVLCSPRKMLMENKKEQHGNDVYLVVNQYEVSEDLDEDISKPILPKSLQSKDEYIMGMMKLQTQYSNELYTRLFHEISEYINSMLGQGKPIKIIVTYDSSYIVRRILESMGIINDFWFCIDEFQSILDDARFKSSTELELLSVLEGIENVLFVSATPMLDKYLTQIKEFQVLPYFELDWKAKDPNRIKKSDLKIRTMKSLSGKMDEIIQSYLQGNFEKAIVERDGQFVEVESIEGVFYVNSVNQIINGIKRNNLRPDQVNILCSDTPFNQSRIDKKLGKKLGFKIGKVPLKGEPHKMFTFCTRTVFLGADFYSTCARSFIFSDSNSNCLSVDISMDLYQILGRERLDENPWKNCAEFYYRATCDYKRMTQDDLDAIVAAKKSETENLLVAYSTAPDATKNSLAKVYEDRAKSRKYSDDYIAVNRRVNGRLTPVLNNLVMINEQRTFDIQQVDYADRFSVFTSISREFKDGYTSQEVFVEKFFQEYEPLGTYMEKIKFICEYLIANPDHFTPIVSNLVDSDKIKQQLITLGPKRIKGLGYNITMINQAMGITIFDRTGLEKAIYSSFEVGKKYLTKFVKAELGAIYSSASFKATPKANDLEQWFEVKRCKVTIDGKREQAIEIVSKKPQ